MQKVLSTGLWKTARAQARSARRRKAAIAYVTQDLLGFRRGDVLVVDASTNSVSCGETDAKLLRTLNKRGVNLYDCAGLHAKVILLDDVAIIGSGNMSNSSANGLVEAGVITDHASTVAGVASFIEQLLPQSNQLDSKRLAELCKIKVVRRGGMPQGVSKQRKPKIKLLGNRTWLVGAHELVKEPTIEEKRLIAGAIQKVRNKSV
jgi:phosphatidylserine/phosphatidylglycerophosphate/cardiolipin synthase-like enzyme